MCVEARSGRKVWRISPWLFSCRSLFSTCQHRSTGPGDGQAVSDMSRPSVARISKARVPIVEAAGLDRRTSIRIAQPFAVCAKVRYGPRRWGPTINPVILSGLQTMVRKRAARGGVISAAEDGLKDPAFAELGRNRPAGESCPSWVVMRRLSLMRMAKGILFSHKNSISRAYGIHGRRTRRRTVLYADGNIGEILSAFIIGRCALLCRSKRAPSGVHVQIRGTRNRRVTSAKAR